MASQPSIDKLVDEKTVVVTNFEGQDGAHTIYAILSGFGNIIHFRVITGDPDFFKDIVIAVFDDVFSARAAVYVLSIATLQYSKLNANFLLIERAMDMYALRKDPSLVLLGALPHDIVYAHLMKYGPIKFTGNRLMKLGLEIEYTSLSSAMIALTCARRNGNSLLVPIVDFRTNCPLTFNKKSPFPIEVDKPLFPFHVKTLFDIIRDKIITCSNLFENFTKGYYDHFWFSSGYLDSLVIPTKEFNAFTFTIEYAFYDSSRGDVVELSNNGPSKPFVVHDSENITTQRQKVRVKYDNEKVLLLHHALLFAGEQPQVSVAELRTRKWVSAQMIKIKATLDPNTQRVRTELFLQPLYPNSSVLRKCIPSLDSYYNIPEPYVIKTLGMVEEILPSQRAALDEELITGLNELMLRLMIIDNEPNWFYFPLIVHSPMIRGR